MASPVRARVDACPGVLAPHDAADGALARVRLPGGQIDAAAMRVLAGCALDLGDGDVHLTSRGNLQLRGLDRADPALEQRLTACGLLPSRTHERVRNVLASPLSGIDGGLADVRALAPALDRALCARPDLAQLSGRFLFAFDDGRGDVAAESPDLCWQAIDDTTGTLLIAGVDAGVSVPISDAVDVHVAAAAMFLQVRGTAWRSHDLPDTARASLVPPRVAVDRPASRGGSAPELRPRADVPPRLAVQSTATRRAVHPDSRCIPPRLAVVVAPVLGQLSAAQLLLLADAAAHAVVTPWRTIVLPDPVLPAARLAEAGLVLDRAPLLSACAGRPGCAKALADVRADARAVLSRIDRRTHVSGCERRCGAPHAPHVDAVALAGGGYMIDGIRQAGL